MRKTKIVATLGPATDDPKIMQEIIAAGVNVVRLNFSHGTHEEQKERLDLFRNACKKSGGPNLPVLLDTKGPEVRTGEFDDKVMLTTNSEFTITMDDIVGDEHRCTVSYKDLYKDITVGDKVLFDDGLIELVVNEIIGTDIKCTVLNDGLISTKKSVNVPGVSLNLPPLTDKDIADLKFACENDFDFVALSFVRKARDIIKAREILEQFGGENIAIISKIENQEGLDNIDDIIKLSDGLMVARGDLGVEIPFEKVPLVQNDLIKRCYRKGKDVITATQMLDSMIRNPRPTRAEVSDISTAIFEGTSAIMLSGETAMGKYPVESVQTMSDVAIKIEESIDYWVKVNRYRPESIPLSTTDSISYATCATAMNINAKAIVTVTSSGKTAKMISKFHPECPIIAVTPDEKVQRQLQLSFGVTPVLSEQQSTTDELITDAMNQSMNTGLVDAGDLIVITAGLPIGMSGTTNLLKVQVVGDVEAHGLGIGDGVITGNLNICYPKDGESEDFAEGDVLVAKYTIHDMLPMIRKASALIVEDTDVKGHSAVTAMALGLPVILGVDNATKILKNGSNAILDIKNGTVRYTEF